MNDSNTITISVYSYGLQNKYIDALDIINNCQELVKNIKKCENKEEDAVRSLIQAIQVSIFDTISKNTDDSIPQYELENMKLYAKNTDTVNNLIAIHYALSEIYQLLTTTVQKSNNNTGNLKQTGNSILNCEKLITEYRFIIQTLQAYIQKYFFNNQTLDKLEYKPELLASKTNNFLEELRNSLGKDLFKSNLH